MKPGFIDRAAAAIVWIAVAVILIIVAVALLSVVMAASASAEDDLDVLAVDIPVEQRTRFRNSDGSCVQCSIGMVGVHMNLPAAEMLLWTSEYGPRVRGGSGPSRVRAYCNDRNIPAYNITGNTLPWIEWALKTGRGCAIQWGGNHMVTAVGISTDGRRFAVCDNNSPQRVDWYSREEFTRRHYPWVVVLWGPAPANQPPAYYPWWKREIP